MDKFKDSSADPQADSKKITPTIGTLWMTATSIGDYKDIPVRSLDLLRTCSLLIFEEDKCARQFLKAAGVHRPWLRYTEQKEAFTLEELEKTLLKGDSALYMSDQGTPGLADPGRDLVLAARRIKAPIHVVPGPSSLTATIAASPIDCRRFHFAGFPPRDPEGRLKFLNQQLKSSWPVILFDTPYRMKPFFESLATALQGTGRRIFVGVDITGPGEDFWYGGPSEILKQVMALPETMNFVVIIEGTHESEVPLKRRSPSAKKR